MSKEKTKPQPLSEKEASRVVGGVGGRSGRSKRRINTMRTPTRTPEGNR